MKFDDLLGETAVFFLPRFGKEKMMHIAKVHGVEARGLWLESQDLTEMFLSLLKTQATPRTIVTFFPYSEIAYAVSAIDGPALSEKVLGLRDPD